MRAKCTGTHPDERIDDEGIAPAEAELAGCALVKEVQLALAELGTPAGRAGQARQAGQRMQERHETIRQHDMSLRLSRTGAEVSQAMRRGLHHRRCNTHQAHHKAGNTHLLNLRKMRTGKRTDQPATGQATMRAQYRASFNVPTRRSRMATVSVGSQNMIRWASGTAKGRVMAVKHRSVSA